MNGLKITVFLLLIMHILPIAVTQLLITEYPFEGKKYGRTIKWICTAANILLNGLVMYEIIMYSKFSFMDIINFTCSYQDIARLAATNIFALLLASLIGIGVYMATCKHYKEEHFFRFSKKCVLLLLLAAIPISLGYHYGLSGASHLAISEICRKTTAVSTEESSLSQAVIEDGVCYVVVVNNGELTYEVDQVYLSDNIDELREQQSFQEVTLKPGETYRLYMPFEDALNIKKSGGSVVYLSDQFGQVVDTLEVPALSLDQSYKSTESGWQVISLTKEESIPLPEISFSHEGGFYDGAFELELTAEPGTTIYYTLDCSDPTVESTEYTGPIHVYDRSKEANQYRSIRNVQENYLNQPFNGDVPVDKCFVVRTIAVDSQGFTSEIITKSYFINQNKYKNRKVISLVSDPDNLFGDENGIYVTGKEYDEQYLAAYAHMDEDGNIDLSNLPAANFWKKGIEWERESVLEVFENADLLLNQPVGIRIQGNSTRGGVDKRFSIYARKEYGSSNYFDVPLFADCFQHSLYTREGDLHAISQIIGRDRDVATVDFVPVDVFLDGEYWYTIYLYEKFNEKNFAQKYNLSKDNVTIAKHGIASDSENAADIEAGKNPLSSLERFIAENDLSDDENYWKYNEILDIQSYIDWSCINMFLQNMDYGERHNNLFWHTVARENREEGDARWRLGLYDMDLYWFELHYIGFDDPFYEANPFTTSWIGTVTHSKWPIYAALKQNGHFCQQFVLTFMDLINTNLSVENTTAIMKSLGVADETYQTFFENRPTYIVPYIAEEFELTGTLGTVTLSSNVSGTPITLNTISPELRSSKGAFAWTGEYFTDYPVTVTANDPSFSHWEITANGSVQKSTDRTIEVPVSTGGVQIHAVFE